MREQDRDWAFLDSGVLKAPAYPFLGRELFRDLRGRLSEAHPGKMTIKRLAGFIGRPLSTTHHWFEISEHPHLIAVMVLLERLSPSQRHNFLDAHCREFPSFRHPRFASSGLSTEHLTTRIKRKSGLTLVLGGTDRDRTFLLTAIGHSFSDMDLKHRNVVGIDFHRPKDFVPLEGVFYFDMFKRRHELRRRVDEAWPRILTAKSPLVLLNGLWSALPDTRNEILRLARLKHVIIADNAAPNEKNLTSLGANVCIVKLLNRNQRGGAIRFSCGQK